MKHLYKTGLPQFDQASFNKGLSDGFRGHAWWPGAGIEPLSYAAGYQESGVLNPRTRPDPGADLSAEPTPPDVTVGSHVVTTNEALSPADPAPLTESDLDSLVGAMQAALATSEPVSPRLYRRAR
jgi:hypothetical protein